jgi:hypothetical protein
MHTMHTIFNSLSQKAKYCQLLCMQSRDPIPNGYLPGLYCTVVITSSILLTN